MRAHTVVYSPVGPLTVVAEDGALVGLYLDGQRHRPAPETFGAPDDGALREAGAQLAEYFAGRRRAFDLPVRLSGTPFQERVWGALQAIEYGEVVTYGELAERIGQAGAARAVGLANGRNRISIVVPCHRVVGAGGSLTGYAGGVARKQLLLELERRHG